MNMCITRCLSLSGWKHLFQQCASYKVKVDLHARLADSYATSVGTIAFAFYLQPIAMPMLAEMPPGRDGYTILTWSMYIVIGGALFILCGIKQSAVAHLLWRLHHDKIFIHHIRNEPRSYMHGCRLKHLCLRRGCVT